MSKTYLATKFFFVQVDVISKVEAMFLKTNTESSLACDAFQLTGNERSIRKW